MIYILFQNSVNLLYKNIEVINKRAQTVVTQSESYVVESIFFLDTSSEVYKLFRGIVFDSPI